MLRFSTSIILTLFININSIAQIGDARKSIDSIYIAGYKAVYYRLSTANAKPEYEWGIYNCDSLILVSDKSGSGVRLHDFCEIPSGGRITCNFQDIDSDGYGEIIFEIRDESKNDGVKYSFFTPDLPNPEHAVFDGTEKGYGELSFKDIDRDGVFELLFRDLNLRGRHSNRSKSPKPYLVYKLFGQQYKLANLYLSIQIMNKIYNVNTPVVSNTQHMVFFGLPDADSLVDRLGIVKYYDPGADSTYPNLLADMMINLTYAGYYKFALVLLDHAWPDNVPGKHIFLMELEDDIKSDPLWNDVKESTLPEHQNLKWWH
jgi:hypothetical protein